MNPEFARRAVMVMFLGAVAIVVWKEWGNQNNDGRPLPRPCKLIPVAIGYTGLGLISELVPALAAMLALGLTVGELVSDAGISGASGTVLSGLSKGISNQTALARSTG
jgi:hypothetical protein